MLCWRFLCGSHSAETAPALLRLLTAKLSGEADYQRRCLIAHMKFGVSCGSVADSKPRHFGTAALTEHCRVISE